MKILGYNVNGVKAACSETKYLENTRGRQVQIAYEMKGKTINLHHYYFSDVSSWYPEYPTLMFTTEPITMEHIKDRVAYMISNL